MANLKCRKCGGEVASDEKARKCRHCNDLFPFECAVCAKHLRPPIPEFPVERYYNDEGEPLCTDHYQRECPECKCWFRADENPGFFLCQSCTQRHQIEGTADENASADHEVVIHNSAIHDDNAIDNADEPREQRGTKAGCVGVFALTLAATMALPWIRAFWS